MSLTHAVNGALAVIGLFYALAAPIAGVLAERDYRRRTQRVLPPN